MGIEAKIGEGDKDAWYRIATIDGKSSTVTVELNPDVIRTLDEHACINWSENGKCDYGGKGNGGKFYKGTIVVRPVFDYIDATVEFKSANPDYGTLNAEAPLPNMLWDFGTDRAMDDLMGIASLWRATNVSWTAESQDSRDYYRFTASGNDPYVSVADHAESIDNIRYLKFAAKNLNGASYSDPSACKKDDSCPMSAFSDLNLSQWYHDGVHWALDKGVMGGYCNGKFGPDDNITRAMIVTMLQRFEGTSKVGNELTFTDVKEGEWYSEAIRWAAANGIVDGYGDGRFGPNDNLTREQLAVILCRYAKYNGIDTSEGELKPLSGFNDAAAISEWAIKHMRWAVDSGIINGIGNDTISPKTSATRSQVATMLMRYSALER